MKSTRIETGSRNWSYRCLEFNAHRSEWDRWLAQASHGSGPQISAHLNSYRPYRAERVTFHVIQDRGGNILAGAGLLSWRLPGLRMWFGEGNGAPVGEVAWWPLLLERISDWAKQCGCMCLGFSPHVSQTDTQAIAALTAVGFVSGKPLAPLEHLAADLRIPLTGQSDEALLASFRRQTRQNIAHSLNSGLQFSTPTQPEEVVRFAQFLHGAATENGVSLRPLSSFVPTVSDLIQSGAGYAAVVEHRGEPMAGGVFVHAGQAHRCYQLATKRVKTDLKAAYFLHWNAIRRARDAGARWYYFTGRSVPSVYQFKRGFRPEEFDLAGHHRLVFRPVITISFEKARPLMIMASRVLLGRLPWGIGKNSKP